MKQSAMLVSDGLEILRHGMRASDCFVQEACKDAVVAVVVQSLQAGDVAVRKACMVLTDMAQARPEMRDAICTRVEVVLHAHSKQWNVRLSIVCVLASIMNHGKESPQDAARASRLMKETTALVQCFHRDHVRTCSATLTAQYFKGVFLLVESGMLDGDGVCACTSAIVQAMKLHPTLMVEGYRLLQTVANCGQSAQDALQRVAGRDVLAHLLSNAFKDEVSAARRVLALATNNTLRKRLSGRGWTYFTPATRCHPKTDTIHRKYQFATGQATAFIPSWH